MPTPDQPARDSSLRGRLVWLRGRVHRVALVSGMALATLNIFTASPLAALWLGAVVQGANGQISMLGVLVIAVSMFTFSILLARVLGRLSDRYDDLTGRPRSVKRHTPWLRSMSGERLHVEHERTGLTPLEICLVLAVILVIGAYEYWFFFEAGSPFDQRSGRSFSGTSHQASSSGGLPTRSPGRQEPPASVRRRGPRGPTTGARCPSS